MIVIGADTHKRNHALAAVDDVAGGVRGAREIKADETGRTDAWFGRAAWMTSGCGQSRIAGTSRGALGGRPLADALLDIGQTSSRRGQRKPSFSAVDYGLTDQIAELRELRRTPYGFGGSCSSEEA